jgi:hypothetical protein
MVKDIQSRKIKERPLSAISFLPARIVFAPKTVCHSRFEASYSFVSSLPAAWEQRGFLVGFPHVDHSNTLGKAMPQSSEKAGLSSAAFDAEVKELLQFIDIGLVGAQR